MESNYPHTLVEQYLKASSKLKKIERIVFKRFAPNVLEVLEEFNRLALKFEETSADQYAAMCYIGAAKCQAASGNHLSECQAFLKAARSFMRAHNLALHFKSNRSEYEDGALRCYTQALERCSLDIDDSVLKAAIIREMQPLQPHFEGTSSFVSPSHGIHELEAAAHGCLYREDFLAALHQLDDIVDNINERKCQDLYEELLCRVEILRVLLLVNLNLPPGRQSPSHIKLLEFYYHLGNFEEVDAYTSSSSNPGAFVTLEMQYGIAEVVVAFLERRTSDLKLALESFAMEFSSLNSAQRFVLNGILKNMCIL